MESFDKDHNPGNSRAADAPAFPYVRRSKRRVTPQRAAILAALREADTPLSVTQILASARRLLPRLSRQAIYRNLRLLQGAREVRAMTMPNREMRYQIAAPLLHNRFCCRQCDKIFDLQSCPILLMGSPHLPPGFVVESYVAMLYGLCASCAENFGTLPDHAALPLNGQNGSADH